MGKYRPLQNYLESCGQTYMTLSYAEIEKIIGDKLPKTAWENAAWWSNNDATHVQSASWSEAGYRTCDIKLGVSAAFCRPQGAAGKPAG